MKLIVRTIIGASFIILISTGVLPSSLAADQPRDHVNPQPTLSEIAYQIQKVQAEIGSIQEQITELNIEVSNETATNIAPSILSDSDIQAAIQDLVQKIQELGFRIDFSVGY